jgi:hypothetical protein
MTSEFGERHAACAGSRLALYMADDRRTALSPAALP